MATYGESTPRKGFFTDTTLCIGCKACEIACKEWNQLPSEGLTFTAQSYDNTGELSGTTWRHVAFVEQRHNGANRWLMESDVCKHCTHAACLDVCPTGALIRTEFGTVVVQDDVCNGCGYCVPACPFGVIAKREDGGHAGKCTMCYDRLRDGETPACAKACPTQSIQFGDLDELRRRADARLEKVRAGEMYRDASLYLRDTDNGIGGAGAFFLLLDRPEVYGLPPAPRDATRDLPKMWRAMGVAAATLVGALLFTTLGGKR
ncbi:MAG: 4Fe-4S dicluster domain-containing protein [Candidatus Eremiobacteraeota bacterium]|nr:4Fe-4S dicluster domain-containing protein [Candidatus Eremiobacteraeota bacterium]